MNYQPNGKQSELQPMLQSIVRSTSAIGAMVWDCDTLPFREHDFYYADGAGPIRLGCSPSDHVDLISAVAQTEQPKVAIPRADDSQQDQPPVIALAPFRRNNQSFVIETFLSPNQSNDQYKENMASILDLLDSGGRDMATDLTPQPNSTVSVEPKQIDDFCNEIYQSNETKDTSYRIANETRRFLAVDRVSVVKFKGKRSKIVAISGQQSVNRRSNTVALLERLARRVLPLRKDFFYPDLSTAIAPQVENVLNDYLKLSVSRSISIVPLFEKAQVEIQNAADRPNDDKLIGGLIIEHFTDDWDQAAYRPLVQTAATHCANAYSNALRMESLFLYPLWRLLGKSKFVTTARNLPISISILVGILILVACLVFIPREFKVVCNGTMLPEEIEYVFAPGKGNVTTIVDEGTVLVSSEIEFVGDSPVVVAKNGVFTLGQIVDPDLEQRLADVKGKIAELQARIANKERGFSGRRAGESAGESLSELESQLKSRKNHLVLVEKQISDLKLTSSLPGKVLTHSTRDKFLGRPISEGALLLEIGHTDGDWIVELKMPDDRIGHVLNAQNEFGEELDVTFVLSTDPSKSFRGTVISVARATEVDQEKGQTVLIKVKISDEVNKSLLRARAQVIGKIHCGKRSLGYVWFHQIGEFMQKNVWFRIW